MGKNDIFYLNPVKRVPKFNDIRGQGYLTEKSFGVLSCMTQFLELKLARQRSELDQKTLK